MLKYPVQFFLEQSCEPPTNSKLIELNKRILQHRRPQKKTIISTNKLSHITTLLNKLTDTTYDMVSREIITTLNNNDDIKSDIDVGNIIFNTLSKNQFYSKLYVKLYVELIRKMPLLLVILTDRYTCFINDFNTMGKLESSNYTAFCENNEKTSDLRSLSLFYTNIMMLDNRVIGLVQIYENLICLFGLMKENPINEEFIEHVYIIITTCKSMLTEAGYIDIIKSEIGSLIENDAINNKIKFKCMDIADLIV